MSHNLSKHPIEESLKKIKKTLVVMSGKGGVGKSTVSVNLATSLVSRGFSVGLLDADLHGPSALRLVGMTDAKMIMGDNEYIMPLEKDGLKIASIAAMLESEETSTIWRGPLKIGVITQLISDVAWGELDYLVVDLPPGTGDEPLTVAQSIKGAEAIVVTTPQEISIIDVKKSINFAKQVNLPIKGIIENMGSFMCPDCGKMIPLFPGHGGQRISKEYNIPFLGSIPFETAISHGSDEGKSVLTNGGGFSSEVFQNIVDNLVSNDTIDTGKSKEENMAEKIISIPTNEGLLDSHFGHAKTFAFYKVCCGSVKEMNILKSPTHEAGVIPNWIADEGADIVIVENIGGTASEILSSRGVEVITGVPAAPTGEIIDLYLKGSLKSSDSSHQSGCESSCGGGCSH